MTTPRGPRVNNAHFAHFAETTRDDHSRLIRIDRDPCQRLGLTLIRTDPIDIKQSGGIADRCRRRIEHHRRAEAAGDFDRPEDGIDGDFQLQHHDSRVGDQCRCGVDIRGVHSAVRPGDDRDRVLTGIIHMDDREATGEIGRRKDVG